VSHLAKPLNLSSIGSLSGHPSVGQLTGVINFEQSTNTVVNHVPSEVTSTMASFEPCRVSSSCFTQYISFGALKLMNAHNEIKLHFEDLVTNDTDL
jgi:hypothetical protein